MRIVDAQVHANKIGARWDEVDPDVTIDATVAAMDAVGVDAIVVDEFSGFAGGHRLFPGHVDSAGAWVSDHPFAALAVERFPHRFTYVSRVDYLAADLDERIAAVVAAPGCRAMRITNGAQGRLATDPDFVEGRYDSMFAALERFDVPVFVFAPGGLAALTRYVEMFPALAIVVDHLGVRFPSREARGVDRYRCLDEVLVMAQYPNVSLKWSHVERLAAEPYPFADATPHLRRVVDAFGARRVMWASDHTQAIKAETSDHPTCWAQSLFHIRESVAFTDDEKAWMLGRSVCSLLGWEPIDSAA